MNNRHAWSTLQLLILVSAAVSPFWFMASSITDLSELKSTGIGAALLAALGGTIRLWQGMHGDSK